MNYYDEIKEQIINNEITKKVKDYSKNRSDLNTYYNVGKLLAEAGKHYGKSIIKEYSKKLTHDLKKAYSYRSLNYMLRFYEFQKMQSLTANLSWGHWIELLSINDTTEILYFVKQIDNFNITTRELRYKIKSKEYERLPAETKDKIFNQKRYNIVDYIKNPIIIRKIDDYKNISERVLKKLILEDLDNFLLELGNGFSYIKNEYKIKMGTNYNYIDLLLYNIEFNCYVVIELKITELKKEYIGQIQIYMNYIDNNLKTINQDKTIGIIICKKDNKYIMEYCSDDRILAKEYKLV